MHRPVKLTRVLDLETGGLNFCYPNYGGFTPSDHKDLYEVDLNES